MTRIMTWKEFVAMVDAKLAELGIEDPELHYLDTGAFPVAEDQTIVVDDDGLTVTG